MALVTIPDGLQEKTIRLAKLAKERLDRLTEQQKRDIYEYLDDYDRLIKLHSRQHKYLEFVKYMMGPTYIHGRHLEIMADAFERVESGACKRLIIAMPPRHPVWVGHNVTMGDGTRKKVGEIVVGDEVITHENRPRRVLEVHEKGVMSTLKIVTHCGRELFAHDTHPFLTPEGWVAASDLRVGQFLALNHGQRFNQSQSPITPEEARLIGYLVGDGHIGVGVSMTMMPDEHREVADFKHCCSSVGFNVTKHSNKYAWGVCIGTRRPTAWADALGLRHKNAYTKEIPEVVINSGRDSIIGFLSGYFTTDGCVSDRSRSGDADVKLSFSSVNPELLRQVQSILLRIGVSARLRRRVNRMQTIRQGSEYVHWVLDITDRSNAARFVEQVPVYHSKIDRIRAPLFQRSFPSKHLPDEIISIERVEDREHRCFTIEEDESFNIEDVVVHNSKSQNASIYFPAWFMGRNPHKKIIQSSNTAELAVDFGRKVRDLVADPKFASVFQGVSLKADSKAAGRWDTNHSGSYFACGVGGSLTGKGSDLLIIDDPFTEQDAVTGATDPSVYDKVYEWYITGPRQRLQPSGSIVLVATRWSKRDLSGRLIRDMVEREGADQWEVIELPAILPSGSQLWPEFWKMEELLATKASLSTSRWNAQYMQQPTSEEGALVKREWWKIWDQERPPKCEYLIQSWDTAFTKTTRSDFSACTTWGVFYTDNEEEKKQANIILLNAHKDRLEFPELKKKALKEYRDWEPDALIVEGRASGQSLIQELRQQGLPVQDFTPSRGMDKIARVNAVSDIFRSGVVWAPRRRWAEEVMEEFASFPNGDHDDLVDSSTAALLRFRQGGFLRLPGDYEEKEAPRKKVAYY